jgi:hypothetical protein
MSSPLFLISPVTAEAAARLFARIRSRQTIILKVPKRELNIPICIFAMKRLQPKVLTARDGAPI